MTADLTREEITHWRDFIVNLDPPDDVDVLLRIMDAARHSLDEPARLAAAKAEGVREGVEACAVWLETQAAAFLDARDQHMRACEATKGGSLAEEMHSRRACSAEATAASLSEAAAGLRRLCPPSAKPDAAVAEVGSDK